MLIGRDKEKQILQNTLYEENLQFVVHPTDPTKDKYREGARW